MTVGSGQGLPPRCHDGLSGPNRQIQLTWKERRNYSLLQKNIRERDGFALNFLEGSLWVFGDGNCTTDGATVGDTGVAGR